MRLASSPNPPALARRARSAPRPLRQALGRPASVQALARSAPSLQEAADCSVRARPRKVAARSVPPPRPLAQNQPAERSERLLVRVHVVRDP